MKNNEEFLMLYDKEADALLRFVSLRINDREHALDIMQESFTRVLHALSKGSEIRDLRAFLFSTARNLLIDSYRQRARRKDESLDDLIEKGGEYEEDLSGTPYAVYDVERVRKLLSELEPPEYREALLLRYVEEWTPSEIAEVLGVSENVVSVRINRAIKKLQTRFNS
jgi:RNA polymerase sigma factor (sigma-70 family)